MCWKKIRESLQSPKKALIGNRQKAIKNWTPADWLNLSIKGSIYGGLILIALGAAIPKSRAIMGSFLCKWCYCTPTRKSTIPISPLVADFSSEYPWNSYGYEWKILNDNKMGGDSTAWYQAIDTPNLAGDYFLRLHYKLGTHWHLPYAGIYTDFSYPPYAPWDFSGYTGIEFEVRNTAPATANTTYFLQVAMLHIPGYEYHEAAFKVQNAGNQWDHVQVPFSMLKTPPWALTQHQSDLTQVFRIAFTVKGSATSGYLDLDNIRLF